jgi:adenylylsulfate kinase-like enzyme
VGEITGFTGINDPYESLHPEITLDMVMHTEVENARMILDYLICKDFVRGQRAQGRKVCKACPPRNLS